ncbi:YokU family protein [Bacillus sp. HMF5848]|uniref:YokU family protein n=1 Tax=Bacillus sp. HMF5848 TaxID=2495421 RepID=UPI000F79C9B2|nr:YokU family protein [Bacillus sp. HMF5848]RSK23930.1 YokU family protein [Bacillus sp. HMF5848]RSK28735.1 YokU family protein [Bacillus sp. HMF5848]
MRCEWCDASDVMNTTSTVYWELPDGTRAIEIEETPGVTCNSCGMEYQSEKVTEEIEDQLLLIDTNVIGKRISYKELMDIPRLLKRNYFKF